MMGSMGRFLMVMFWGAFLLFVGVFLFMMQEPPDPGMIQIP